MSKMSITKIMLETKDGQAVHLTLAEAKDLYQQLHELFGEKPIMWPSYPIVIERDRLPWAPYQPTWVSPGAADTEPSWPVVTCHAGGSGLKAHYTGPVEDGSTMPELCHRNPAPNAEQPLHGGTQTYTVRIGA